MKNLTFNVLAIAFVTSCVTRAPTENELDRRAGLAPIAAADDRRDELEEQLKGLHPITGKDKPTRLPLRSSARLERVWVYDQELDGGYWLQGTYLYLEVEPGRWIEEEREAP